MRITQKGQITIPVELREKYGFLPYSEVFLIEEKGRIYLKKVSNQKRRGRGIIARLRGTASVRMTTDEILALTREKK